jgi:hypothetical protein
MGSTPASSEKPSTTDARAPHFARRQYLIDRRFQLKYTALIVAVASLIMALFSTAIWRELRANSELAVGQRMLSGAGGAASASALAMRETLALTEDIAHSDQRQFIFLLVASLVVILALGIWGVLITHRVAGPVLVLSRYTQALGEGQFPPIRQLRKGDELQVYFDTFRHAVEQIKIREAQEADDLETAAAQLAAGARGEDAAAVDLILRLVERKRLALGVGPEPDPMDAEGPEQGGDGAGSPT